MPVANFALTFQTHEAVQRQNGPDHVFPDPLGLGLSPAPDPAAKGETSARHSPASLSTGECGGNGSPGQRPGPLPPWTLNFVCHQDRIRSAHSWLKSPLLTRSARTSLPKISASRTSSKRGTLWKIPARSTPPSVNRRCRCGWKLIRSPKVWTATMMPGTSSSPGRGHFSLAVKGDIIAWLSQGPNPRLAPVTLFAIISGRT
jgi:hypothetical protein